MYFLCVSLFSQVREQSRGVLDRNALSIFAGMAARGRGRVCEGASVRRAKGQVISVSLRERSFPFSFIYDLIYSENVNAVVFLKACNLQNRPGGQDENSGILISTWRARYLGPRRHADATVLPLRPLPSPPRSPWRDKRPLPLPSRLSLLSPSRHHHPTLVSHKLFVSTDHL